MVHGMSNNTPERRIGIESHRKAELSICCTNAYIRKNPQCITAQSKTVRRGPLGDFMKYDNGL